MVTFAIATIMVSVFLVSVVAVSLYIRPSKAPRRMQVIKREPEQDLHDIIFANEKQDLHDIVFTHQTLEHDHLLLAY